MYAEAQPQGQSQGPGEAKTGKSDKKDENVVDAEFEEVKEAKK